MHREYAADLPRIEAYGSELNQVWTNLIDNAIDAMDGQGEIILRTRCDGAWVIVEIEDNGPGIPEAVLPHDLRPVLHHQAARQGHRAGPEHLHNIIVQKHKGRIDGPFAAGQDPLRGAAAAGSGEN